MTIEFSEGGGPPSDLMAITEDWLKDSATKLALTVQAIRAGTFGEVKEAQQLMRDLKLAVQLTSDERNRVEKHRKQIVGAIGGGSLDLDAARLEIGRRLACLRDAADH